jgi:hypothetical protein
MKTQTEQQSLQNAANKVGAIVTPFYMEDKRKKQRYFLKYGETVVSPTLCYDKLNHFIYGMIRMAQIIEIKNYKTKQK